MRRRNDKASARFAVLSIAAAGAAWMAIAPGCGGDTSEDLFGDVASSGATTTSTTASTTTEVTTTAVTTTGTGGGGAATTSSAGGMATSSAGGMATSSAGGMATSSAGGMATSSVSSSSAGGGAVTSSSSAMPTCGDGNIDPGETCDGTNLGTHNCTQFGYSDPDGLACKANCHLDSSGCHATCDGVKLEPGEACDGTHLGGADCQDFGFVAPDGLTCVDCALDSSGCHATCGNNVVEPGEVCDGTDLDGDNCTEFGYVDPTGLACTACALDTTGCHATCGNFQVEPGEECDQGPTGGNGCSATCQLEGTTCASTIPIAAVIGPAIVVTGTTAGGGAHQTSSCGSSGPDRIYEIQAQADGFLTLWLQRSGTTFASVMWATPTCDDASVAGPSGCNDNTGGDGGEVLSTRVSAGQTVFAFVDSASPSASGAYALSVDLSAGSNCFDPVPITLEAPGGGDTFGLFGDTTGETLTTAGSCGGTPGTDVVYQINLTSGGALQAATDPSTTNYNAVLYGRSQCGDATSELACSNNPDNQGEQISLPAGSASWFLWVDGSNNGTMSVPSAGKYVVTLTP